MDNKEFIGCTVGLWAVNAKKRTDFVRVQYYRNADRSVDLQVVQAENLGIIGGSVCVSDWDFSSRPQSQCDYIDEAWWAFNKCGWFVD